MNIITYRDKGVKFTFLNSKTVVVETIDFVDTVSQEPIPIVVTFNEKMYYWQYDEMKATEDHSAIKCYFPLYESVTSELASDLSRLQRMYYAELENDAMHSTEVDVSDEPEEY